MAIPTTLIGCLPSYQSIGLVAPVLLIICRLLQGLAAGGEFTGSIIYIIEHAPAYQRGFYGSLAMSSVFCGLLTGSAVSLFVYQHYPDSLHAWRAPFLTSLILGAVGLYLRKGIPESPVFERYIKQHKTAAMPLAELLKSHRNQLFQLFTIVILPSTGFYLSFIYLPTF